MKSQICFFIESRYGKNTGRCAVFFFLSWSLSPYCGQSCPLLSVREQGAQLLCHLRGVTGASRRRSRRYACDDAQRISDRISSARIWRSSQSACGTVIMSPSNRRRVQRPDKVARAPSALPSFPLFSPRFSSFLVVSQAFHLGSASISGTSPPQSCKAGPIQAERPRGRARRQECGASDGPSNLFKSSSGQVARGKEARAPPLGQFSASLISSPRFPITGPHMSFDSVLEGPQSTPNNVFPKSECAYVSETCLLKAPRGSIWGLGVGDGSTATSGTPYRREKTRI